MLISDSLDNQSKEYTLRCRKIRIDAEFTTKPTQHLRLVHNIHQKAVELKLTEETLAISDSLSSFDSSLTLEGSGLVFGFFRGRPFRLGAAISKSTQCNNGSMQ